jgi:hypothetical protein
MIRWNRVPSALVVAAMLVLAPACSAQTPELSVDAARELQSRLPEVRQAAAGNDYTRALGLLEEFEKELDEAAGDGKMTFARYQGISSALEDVRNELQALAMAAAQAAGTTEVPSADPGATATAVPDVATAPLPPAPTPLTEAADPPENADGENGSADKIDADKPGAGKPDAGKPDPDGKNKNP